jgi:TP901-1 family phage major tail protein
MTAQAGRELLLKLEHGGSFMPVGGFKSNSFSINDENIEVTNKDSGGFREILAGAGIRTVSTSGSGVFVDDAVFAEVNQMVLNSVHGNWQIIVPNFGIYEGRFAVVSLDVSGEYNGEVTYDISLDSAGPISFTPE